MKINKIKKLNFLEWNNNIFMSSIKKINLNLILIVFLDVLFYFSSGYLYIFWHQRIQVKIAAFNLPTDIISLGRERALQLINEVRAFYYLIIFSFILLLIAVIFLASILKGIIWAKTTNTKISFALISKFLGLNLIWMSFWFLLVFLISWLVEPKSAPIFMIITIILGFYFTNTVYTLFMKEHKLKAIISGLKLNITKIYLFLLPCLVILLLFFIIVRLSNPLKFSYSTIFTGLLVITFAAAVRYYVSTLVLQVEKRA